MYILRAMKQHLHFFQKLGYKPNDVVAGNLLGLSLQVKDYKKMAAELGIGEITLRDIVKELEKPARILVMTCRNRSFVQTFLK